MAVADPLKHALKALGFSDAQLWGDLKDVVDERWGTTPRGELQAFGDYCRKRYGPEFLARLALERFDQLPEDTDLVLFADVRFAPEADVVHKLGGKVWRVDRPAKKLKGLAAAHVSEQPLPERLVDLVVRNDGTLEEYVEAVRERAQV